MLLSNFIKDKAREIAYALIRVSFYIKRAELRFKVENLAFELLENSSKISVSENPANFTKALEVISALDGLIRLGHSIYEIEPVNATILVKELDGLNSAIRSWQNVEDSRFGNDSASSSQDSANGPLNLESMFFVKQPEVSEATVSDSPVMANNTNSKNEPERDEENGNSPLNIAIRQTSIINRIKSGNGNGSVGSPQAGCRLKDLIAEFSDVSERTLRYDLQRLCERGIIERVGNGGPASYYRLAEISKPTVVSKAALGV